MTKTNPKRVKTHVFTKIKKYLLFGLFIKLFLLSLLHEKRQSTYKSTAAHSNNVRADFLCLDFYDKKHNPARKRSGFFISRCDPLAWLPDLESGLLKVRVLSPRRETGMSSNLILPLG